MSKDILQAPFVQAIRAQRMTLIIISSEDHRVLHRIWCALEAHMCMVEAQDGFLTDIYTHHLEEVMCLTDGLLPADGGDADEKAWRDSEFPMATVLPALDFDVSRAAAAMKGDKELILEYMRKHPGGKAVVNNTVRARYFVSALPTLIKSNPFTRYRRLAKGFAALSHSELRRISLTSKLGKARALTLVRALPRTISEVLLPGVGIGDKGAKIIVDRLFMSGVGLRTLDLSENELTDATALALGKALEVNATLTTLYLNYNKIS
jgi:hypothetical protein